MEQVCQERIFISPKHIKSVNKKLFRYRVSSQRFVWLTRDGVNSVSKHVVSTVRANADQKSLETVFSTAICRQSGRTYHTVGNLMSWFFCLVKGYICKKTADDEKDMRRKD